MKYTNKLGLPIWDNPETDVFDIGEFNKGNKIVDDIIVHILKQNQTTKEEVETINSQMEQKTYYCNTVADMKNKNFKVGDCVNTLGYYAINDGGKGEYIIISIDGITSDNGKYIVLNNGLIASLIDNNVNNVRQFGA